MLVSTGKLSLVAILMLGTTAPALAQRGGFDMSRMVERMDGNQNGQIDEDEVARMPGSFRTMLEEKRVRFPISNKDFGEMMPKMFAEMRERYTKEREKRERDGGDDRGRDGDDGDRGRYGRGGDRGGDDGDRGRYGRGRSGRDGGDSKSSSKKPEPVRVTVDLPESYAEGDINKDGQVALFEWRQWKPKEIPRFFALDANRDGILTPRELAIAEKFPPLDDALAILDGPPATSSENSSAPANTKAAESAKPASNEKATAPEARYVFKQLDKDHDGKLSEDEWDSSKSAKKYFKEARIRFDHPIDLAGFTAVYPEKRLYPQIPDYQLK